MSPKVSPEYLEARRQQILDAARECFTERGYHRTTVQDICRRAGLSPGAVYRYFDSKEAIFEGLAERRLAAHTEAMASLEDVESIFATVAAFAEQMIAIADRHGAPRPGIMDLELVGEAMNNERIAGVVRRMLTGIRGNLGGLVERLQADGKIDPALDPAAVASVLMALFQGALFQSAIGLDFDPEAYLAVVRRLDLPHTEGEGS